MSYTELLYYIVPILLVIYTCLYIYNSYTKSHRSQQLQSEQQSLNKRRREPVSDNRIFTLAELAKYNGSNPTSAILIGCKGLVFDMTQSEQFYGPEGPYSAFAGHDASVSLGCMDMSYRHADARRLSRAEQNVLDEWFDKFESKYPVVGKIVDFSEPNSGQAPPNGWPPLQTDDNNNTNTQSSTTTTS